MIKKFNKYIFCILLSITITPLANAMEVCDEDIQQESLQEALPCEVLSTILEYVMHQAYHESVTNVDLDKALKDLYQISHLIYDLTHTNPLRKLALILLFNKTKQMEKWVKMSQSVKEEWGIGGLKIHSEIMKGNIEQVKTLLLSGIDVNTLDIYGNTPLITSANRNNKEIVKLLLEADADVNLKNDEGSTALHKALEWLNGKPIVKMLLDAKANINTPNVYGTTPLMSSWKPSVIKMILAKKPNLDAQDSRGATALIDAVICSFKERVKLLLAAGARIDLKLEGKTALTIAIKNEDYDIAQLIIEAIQERQKKQN